MRHSLQQAGFDKVHIALLRSLIRHSVCASETSVPKMASCI